MSPSPSRTVPCSFVVLPSSKWRKRDDSSDDDDDDDDNSSSTSASHSKWPQPTHSQSSQHDGNSGNSSSQVTSGKSNAGAIAGGIIAGIFVLAVLALFWWKRCVHRSKPRVKIEIDPMSPLNGEVYARKKPAQKHEEQSLIHERSSTVDAVSSPRPSQPQFWQVHNVDEADTDVASLNAPIPRNVPGIEKKIVSDIPIKQPREKSRASVYTSSVNLIPVPEKDFPGYAAASSSKAELKSSYTSRSSTESTTKYGNSAITRSSTLLDSQSPSAWKEKEGMKQTDEGFTKDSGSQASTRRFSEPEANDLALAAKEEVSDLRRRVELLKQENAELTGRRDAGNSFERLPAYHE